MPGSRASPPLRALLAAAVAALPPLLVVGCAPEPPIGGSSGAVPDAGAAAMAERLPVVAAGFRQGATRPASPGRGREVAYSTEAGVATAAAIVEVLADGTAPGPALEALLTDVLRAGPARELREAGRFTVPAPAAAAVAEPPLLCAETAGRYGRERVAGLVCAGRAGGALLRIRVAMPARQPAPADPRAFAEAIAASLAGPARDPAAAVRRG